MKALLDNLDEVPEAIRGEYEEVDGKFKLKLEDAEDVFASGLKKKNIDLLKDKAKLQEKLKGFSKYEGLPEFDLDKLKSLDPDKLAEALEFYEREHDKDHADDKRNNKADKTIIDQMKLKWEADKKKEIEPLQTENASLKAQIRDIKLEVYVKSAALKAGVFEEDVDDVVKLTQHRFRFEDDDKVVVLDDDGDATSMSVKNFFEDKFKAEKPKFFKGTNAGGSGASAGRGGAGNGAKMINRAAFDKLDAVEKRAKLKAGVQVVD